MSYAIRTISGVEDFRLPDAPPLDAALGRLLESGATRREWCFVVARDGVDVGRVAFRVDDTCPPELLGDLPPREVFVHGLWLPWGDPSHLEAGRFLLERARERLRADLPETFQAIVNRANDEHAEARCAVLEAAGYGLFQEKQGFTWTRGASPTPPPSGRLRFVSLDEVGHERYRQVLGAVGEGTLDRNDAWYRAKAGEENWGKVFMTFLGPDDAKSWLLATLPDGEPVGMVAVGPLEEGTATIVFVGVLPAHRGNGYIDDLVRAGTQAAEARGFASMLSDADVLNVPMTTAFERNGHRADARPWHKWHYRL